MIWYYLYMGLLILALAVWVLAAILPPKRPPSENVSPASTETVDFPRRKE